MWRTYRSMRENNKLSYSGEGELVKQDTFSFLGGTALVVKHCTKLSAALPTSTLRWVQSHGIELKTPELCGWKGLPGSALQPAAHSSSHWFTQGSRNSMVLETSHWDFSDWDSTASVCHQFKKAEVFHLKQEGIRAFQVVFQATSEK